jgi:hypothetical protein
VRGFFLFLAFSIFLTLNAAAWRETKSFVLKKDQLVKVLVKSEGEKKLLSFRWTLYTDKALVVHENFDRFVGQHILSTGFGSQSFQKQLLNAKRSQRDVPVALVVFKKFDEGNNTAQLDLFLIDKENRVVLDYLTEK